MKVRGPGAGEFSIGSGDEEPPFQAQARDVEKVMKKFQGDTSQGKSLENRLSESFDPSNINRRIFNR